MGKVEDMRRLREQRAAASAASTTAPVRRASTQAAPPVKTAPAAAEPDPVADAGLCGHTSISGRSCTRERDHQKAGTKNHRYG